ncbi:MAG: hypothetical protein R3F43_19690 [bacterium]
MSGLPRRERGRRDVLAWRTLAEPAADGDRRLHHLRDGVIE